MRVLSRLTYKTPVILSKCKCEVKLKLSKSCRNNVFSASSYLFFFRIHIWWCFKRNLTFHLSTFSISRDFHRIVDWTITKLFFIKFFHLFIIALQLHLHVITCSQILQSFHSSQRPWPRKSTTPDICFNWVSFVNIVCSGNISSHFLLFNLSAVARESPQKSNSQTHFHFPTPTPYTSH